MARAEQRTALAALRAGNTAMAHRHGASGCVGATRLARTESRQGGCRPAARLDYNRSKKSWWLHISPAERWPSELKSRGRQPVGRRLNQGRGGLEVCWRKVISESRHTPPPPLP